MSEGISAKRITGDDLRRWWRGVGYPVGKDTPDFVATLLAQINADATLATRLAEAERRAMAAEASYAGAEDDYRKVSVELARLRPLAAEAEAWEKILAHPMRAKDFIIVHDQDDGWSVSPLSGPRLSAPTAVALLEKLDALVKPEPEDWRLESKEGWVSQTSFPSASLAIEFGRKHAHRCRPMRRTVDPVTGVVTLSPAPAPDTRNEGE